MDGDPRTGRRRAERQQGVERRASALRIRASSLPDEAKGRLLDYGDQRISSDGVVIIKAQRFRSLDRNRIDALARLQALVDQATATERPRKPTRPTASSQRRRVETKVQRGRIKAARGRIIDE